MLLIKTNDATNINTLIDDNDTINIDIFISHNNTILVTFTTYMNIIVKKYIIIF